MEVRDFCTEKWLNVSKESHLDSNLTFHAMQVLHAFDVCSQELEAAQTEDRERRAKARKVLAPHPAGTSHTFIRAFMFKNSSHVCWVYPQDIATQVLWFQSRLFVVFAFCDGCAECSARVKNGHDRMET